MQVEFELTVHYDKLLERGLGSGHFKTGSTKGRQTVKKYTSDHVGLYESFTSVTGLTVLSAEEYEKGFCGPILRLGYKTTTFYHFVEKSAD